MHTDLAAEIALNPKLCRECGGRCCNGSPGLWVDPRRFFNIFFAGRALSLDELRERLPHLGLVLWEKRGVPIPAPASVFDGCSFRLRDGCRLSVQERPCQCLTLIPNEETLAHEGCVCRLPEDFSFARAKLAWAAYWQEQRD